MVSWRSDKPYTSYASYFSLAAANIAYLSLMLPFGFVSTPICLAVASASLVINQIILETLVYSHLRNKTCQVSIVDKTPERNALNFDVIYLRKSRSQENLYYYAYQVGDRCIRGKINLSAAENFNGRFLKLNHPLVKQIGYRQAVKGMYTSHFSASWQDGALFGLVSAIILRALVVGAFVILAPTIWYMTVGIGVLMVCRVLFSLIAPMAGVLLASRELNRVAARNVETTLPMSRAFPLKQSIFGRLVGACGNDAGPSFVPGKF